MRKHLLVSALFFILAGLSPFSRTFAAPPQWTTDQGSKRINIAGRQRMLSQRMTKAVCFAIVGIDADNQRQIATAAAYEFAETLNLLLDGDTQTGWGAEKNEVIRVALEEVQRLSRPLVHSTLQLAAGDLHTVPMQLVITRNLPTLARMNEVVVLIVQGTGGSALAPEVKNTLDLAGRQRVRSQRIAKDMCMINVKMDVEASLKDLRRVMTLFEKTLRGLIDGDADLGLLAAPTPKIEKQLMLVSQLWSDMEPDISDILNGHQLSKAQMLTAVVKMDLVLAEMNRAVGFWAQHAGAN